MGDAGKPLRCAGLVLAAGAGSRLGRPKATVDLGGTRLVDRAVATLAAGGLAPVLVVEGAAAVGDVEAVVVHNAGWRTGIAGSLRVGLGAAETYEPTVDAVAITLVDLPGMTPEAVRRVLAAADAGAQAVVATYGGRRGHPVLVRRADWSEVAELAGAESGARAFLARHVDDVVEVECGDVASGADIDTAAQLAAARAQLALAPAAGSLPPAGRGSPQAAPPRRPPARPTREQLAAAADLTVPDLVAPGLEVLFCGINPGLYTAYTGHHFARPGNRFWPTLHRSGFTPRLLAPYEQEELLALGLGITNVAARASATAAELSRAELTEGVRRLAALAEEHRPAYVAVLGVTAYRAAFDEPRAALGPQDRRLGRAKVWVLPNPSGLNAHYTPARLAEVFAELRAAVT